MGAGADKEEKRVSDPLELGLQMCANNLVCAREGPRFF